MKYKSIITLLTFLIPVIFIFSVSLGAYPVELSKVWGVFLTKLSLNSGSGHSYIEENIIYSIRLPRVILGFIIGASLAISGVGMQGLFRNPLADPGLIGISSGAVFATACTIVLGWSFQNILGYYGLSFFAFLGALVSAVLVVKLSSVGKSTTVSLMLLVGLALNALFGAGTSFLIYLAKDDELRSITFWTLGSLGGANWTVILTLLPILILPAFLLYRMSSEFDAFSLGESEAYFLGVDVQKLKRKAIIYVTLSVSASIALVGMIGFIGLIVPHITRTIVGVGHKKVFVVSILLGGILLVVADTLARTIVMPAELPIGILTALMGTPLFLSLIIKHKKGLV